MVERYTCPILVGVKRAWLLLIALFACDHEADVTDAAPSLSAIIPPLPASSIPPPPTPTPTPTPTPSASAPSGDAGITCGSKGLPPCPLQGWMKTNMTPPMNAKDWQGIADALERAALIAPPPAAGYTNWVSIAKDGANAARAAELDAVKAACRGCHDQYKNKYRAEMRMRPVP
jgi:hypothetical protein